jgi:glycosyltransferase involved in cell wall biosynthesis
VDCPGVEAGEFRTGQEKQNRVLFVGKIHIRKGMDLLLDVARALPHVPFDVVGWGDEDGAFRKQAPANVQFHEFPGGEKLWPVFESAGILFLPSRAETFGMAVLQAMAAGCAVISTVPLPYEGALVQSENLPEMIAAVDHLWSDPAARQEAGMTNAVKAREFTWNRFCGHLLNLYEELQAPRLGPGATRLAGKEIG